MTRRPAWLGQFRTGGMVAIVAVLFVVVLACTSNEAAVAPQPKPAGCQLPQDGAALLGDKQQDTKHYAIVVSKATAADRNWAGVVEVLGKKYDGRFDVKVFSYDYPGVGDVQDSLRQFMPWYICVVARPEEAGREQVMKISRLITQLDSDPYEDAIWAVLTGYSVEDALRIATAENLVIDKGLSGVHGGWLEWFDSGLAFSEGERNAKFVKEPGQDVKKELGPDDTAKEFADALNTNRYQVMSTSGHANERHWVIGYSYKNGEITCDNGKLFAVDMAGQRYPIVTDNPKIYYSPGNCLIGNIPKKDCMALAWIHNGVNQFFGHLIPQGQPCNAWAIADYFFSQQGRVTYAEAVYAQWVALQYETRELGKSYPCCSPDGQEGTPSITTVLYGDPAWEARMKPVVKPPYDQELSVGQPGADGRYEFEFKITMNQDAGMTRHPFALLPFQVQHPTVVSEDVKRVVVADNFVLIHVQDAGDPPLKKGETRTVRFTAERCSKWEYSADDGSHAECAIGKKESAGDKASCPMAPKQKEAAASPHGSPPVKGALASAQDNSGTEGSAGASAPSCAVTEGKAGVSVAGKSAGEGTENVSTRGSSSTEAKARALTPSCATTESKAGTSATGKSAAEGGALSATPSCSFSSNADASLAATRRGGPDLAACAHSSVPPYEETASIAVADSISSAGLAVDGDRIWIVDAAGTGLRSLATKDRKGGWSATAVGDRAGLAGKRIAGVCSSDGALMVVSSEGPDLLELSRKDGKVKRSDRLEVSRPGAIAWRPAGSGGDTSRAMLFVVEQDGNRILAFDPVSRKQISSCPAPSGNATGLAWDGRWLWVADGADHSLYMVDCPSGRVITIIRLDFAPSALSWSGDALYTVNLDQKRCIGLKVDRSRKYVIRDRRQATVKCQATAKTDGELYVALPSSTNRQMVVVTPDSGLCHQAAAGRPDSLSSPGQVAGQPVPSAKVASCTRAESPSSADREKIALSHGAAGGPDSLSLPATGTAKGCDMAVDEWGQKAASYKVKEGDKVEMKIQADLYEVTYLFFPDSIGGLEDIPADIKSQYLVDGEKLQINDVAIQDAAREILARAKGKNAYWLAREVFDYTFSHVPYKKEGGWPAAPEVLKRGYGTCSPITFVFVALSRACGLPARYAAGTRYRGADPSMDTEFHRWAEVYLPGYGWVPVDPSGTNKDCPPAAQAGTFGHIPNIDLVMMTGGGGSSFFGWGYNVGGVESDHAFEWSGIR